MPDGDKIILVTGATGKQGGAVARHLLSENWQVRALTRNPDKPEAHGLKAMGAEIIQGDLRDRTSLDRALRGCYGVFSVQNFRETGYELEVEEGKLLADIAKDAGVEHFVYSSVGGAERHTGIPHFDSKALIEQHIKSLGLPATIFRPVFFMDNFNSPDFKEGILNSTLVFALPHDVPLQMIAVADIGGFGALAFDNPEQFIGRELELAGDELTMPQVAEAFSREIGKTVRYVQIPLEQLRAANPEYAIMVEWFIKEGYKADIPALREMYPGLMTFDDWVRTEATWLREGLLIAEATGAHQV